MISIACTPLENDHRASRKEQKQHTIIDGDNEGYENVSPLQSEKVDERDRQRNGRIGDKSEEGEKVGVS